MDEIDAIITGLIVFQTFVVALAVGFGLWWYKRALGREGRQPSLPLRIFGGILGIVILANSVGGLRDSEVEPLRIAALAGTWVAALLVALGAGRIIRSHPHRSRLVIPLAALLSAGVTLMGSAVYFGPLFGSEPAGVEGRPLPAGRIDVGEPGIAITFPDAWTVYAPTEGWERAWGPSSPSWRTLVYGRPPGGTGGEMCRLVDASADRGDANPALFRASLLMANDRQAAEDPDIVEHHASAIRSPFGPVNRSDFTWEGGWQASYYNFVDDARWIYLDCQSKVPPEDRWLSIVESIEFLPDKGRSGGLAPRQDGVE